MGINEMNLLIDFGLVVLIWLVQLVIYPSFLHYPDKDLIQWHHIYTKRISLVVVPLMVVQAVLALLQSYQMFGALEAGRLSIIIAVWISTFVQFVPLHQKIASGAGDPQMLHRLVNRNWVRTVLWNGLFFLDLSIDLG